MYNSVRSTAPIIMAMGIIYEPQKGAIPHSEANFSNNPCKLPKGSMVFDKRYVGFL
ncbi:hypothetical protein [Porphyromonas gingivicanis]|uniref:hypothetical protein n=1 Tax=Porphyromonas gingivicanis TaxID=266762 RepID=UPI00131EE01F|nr:hypothetical protein [Porphyromonas gingivicanis]